MLRKEKTLSVGPAFLSTRLSGQNSVGPDVLLVDNGSLLPAATLLLRQTASALSWKTGQHITPVSYSHSHKICPRRLEGVSAQILDRYLFLRLCEGQTDFVAIPFLAAGGGAIESLIRKTFLRCQSDFSQLRWELACAPGALPDGPFCLARALVDQIEKVVRQHDLSFPRVVVVDHGSPVAAPALFRNRVAGYVHELLQGRVEAVGAASMESREGPEYSFNQPLLADLLRQSGWKEGPVILALLFLSPGRHAGPGGDIAAIANSAREDCPSLLPYLTDPIGNHPLLLDGLVRSLATLPKSA